MATSLSGRERLNVPRFTRRLTLVGFALGGALVLLVSSLRDATADAPRVHVITLEGEINAVTSGYVSAAVMRAGSDRAGALVIMTNTPGGQSAAMDDIVTTLLNAPVPVAVYVAPTGARAASAGLFVAQAADVVAMAPGTNIGSAHPVTGSGGDIGGDLGRKVLNDAVARIRNLATLHGRNAEWCEQAVRDSVNIGADQAARTQVADVKPATLSDLLAWLDGRPAPRPSHDLTFHTGGATIVDDQMSAFQRALQVLIDPNVAYLLMLVAAFGLIAEVSSPGAILPGVVGGISAILALVALTTLPVNLGGILLIGFAFLLFLADVKAPTHGVLTVGGLASLLLGSAFLLNTSAVDLGIDWRLIVAATAAVGLGVVLVLRKAITVRSTQTSSSSLNLVGAIGEARGPLSPGGEVFVAGATWPAVSVSGPIASGHTVRVIAQTGGALQVEPARRSPPETALPQPPLPAEPVSGGGSEGRSTDPTARDL
ncbi:MAG TPA: nodulation protein NfeD [Candidatus Dormibacteraeota bacterium]|nr:nodulation protein NfeD [Candidatus Dormibacteraeota bacterium]